MFLQFDDTVYVRRYKERRVLTGSVVAVFNAPAGIYRVRMHEGPDADTVVPVAIKPENQERLKMIWEGQNGMIDPTLQINDHITVDGHGKVQVATALVALVHARQKDLVGEPYTFHLWRVAEAVRRKYGCVDTTTVALLHDILEDHPETVKSYHLYEMFGAQITDAVIHLTKSPGEDYDRYIDRLIDIGNPLVLRVKLADLDDHLDPGKDPFDYRPSKDRTVRYKAAWRRIFNVLRRGRVNGLAQDRMERNRV